MRGKKDQGEGDTADCARVQKACGSVFGPMGFSVKQKQHRPACCTVIRLYCTCVAISSTFSECCGKRKHCAGAENIFSLGYV